MNTKILLRFLILTVVLAAAACNPSEDDVSLPSTSAGSVEGSSGADSDTPDAPDTPENSGTMNRNLTVTIGTVSFAALLEDNASARAFAAMLPLEVRMDELNGNEKYTTLSTSLPTAPAVPDMIETGDLMLWGSECLVLFYASFPTSYSYTRLGRIVDPAGLAAAVGYGSATVRFEPAQQQN